MLLSSYKRLFLFLLYVSLSYAYLMANIGINEDSLLLIRKDKRIQGNYIIQIEPEIQNIVRNPLMGWAIYCDAYNPDMEFWNKFDNIVVEGYEKPFKASDYATHLYIRWPWSAFERSEGEYAWEYDDFLNLLEDGAIERGLKLAYRIYVDSRDYPTQSSPDYLREAGVQGFISNTKIWSPYPDDPIFQEKYEKFIKAFAERYNNLSKVEYIDGYGLGKWGEGHSVIYKNNGNRENVFKWIIDLYSKYFTEIPLALNYHRLIASEKEWGTPDANSENLLNYAYEKGYILRHDAFGMGDYYGDFEKKIVKKYFPKKPIIAENGWWHNGTTHWKGDPNGYKLWRDVWEQTLMDALNANANILDLRNISETKSWFTTSFDLVEEFVSKGGYRIYPDSISLPKKIKRNQEIKIVHRWSNIGFGVCPTNIKPWNNQYKVGFALLNKKNENVDYLFIDNTTDPSKWLKGYPISYNLSILSNDILEGEYVWGIAIIDIRKNNKIGINLSAKGNLANSGWLKLCDVRVE